MARKTHKYIKKKPELVAPAGSLKHLEAAISEGADSVYVGPVGLSGRPPMAEMTMTKIQKARKITKENGRRLYVAVNAAMPWGKKKSYLNALKQLIDMEADALIIGDPAVLDIANSLPGCPEIHASTFLGIYNPPAAAWAKSLGFKRMVLNTGLLPDEIRSIARQVPNMEYELIAYGPICFNDNHRCNLPHGVRSSKAKKDALNFSREFTYCQSRLEVRKGGRLIKQGRLLCWPMIDLSESLMFYMSLGVSAFKIAGRERETEYVRAAVRRMRKALDSLPDAPPPMDPYACCLHIAERKPVR